MRGPAFAAVAATLFEAGALYALTVDHSMLALACHLIAAALAGVTIWFVLALRIPERSERTRLMPLVVTLLLLLPGANPGLCMTLYIGYRYPRTTPKRPLQTLDVPSLPFKPLELEAGLSFANGGLYDVLRHSVDPEKRLATVRAATRMRDAEAVPLLQLAMRDPVDDVRLVAYSIKDKIESRVNAEITEYQKNLEHCASPWDFAELQRLLAFAYWELVYLGLVEGDLKTFILGRVIDHCEASLALKPSNSVTVLIARACLAKGNLDRAEAMLQEALANGLNPNAVSTYLAEIAFLRGDFSVVAQELATLPPHIYTREPIFSVYRTWVKEGQPA